TPTFASLCVLILTHGRKILISDLIDDVHKHQSPNIVILVSGDGDFANSVSVLRQLGKKVIVMA
ncbi:hypothetical protein CBP16_11160, partial [Fischerella thermalis WC217]